MYKNLLIFTFISTFGLISIKQIEAMKPYESIEEEETEITESSDETKSLNYLNNFFENLENKDSDPLLRKSIIINIMQKLLTLKKYKIIFGKEIENIIKNLNAIEGNELISLKENVFIPLKELFLKEILTKDNSIFYYTEIKMLLMDFCNII